MGVGALEPLTRKTFIHFVAKAGDGFAPPTAGGTASALATAFATTAPSARVAASMEEQEGDGVLVLLLLLFFVALWRRTPLPNTAPKSWSNLFVQHGGRSTKENGLSR